MRLHSAASEEAKTLNSAGDNPSTTSSAHPAADAAVGSRGASQRDNRDYDLEIIYSGVGWRHRLGESSCKEEAWRGQA